MPDDQIPEAPQVDAEAARKAEHEARAAAREARKHVGVFDTDAAKAAKAEASRRIDQVTGPAADYVRENVGPTADRVTGTMKAMGWKKFGLVLAALAVGFLLTSLIARGLGH